MSKAKLIRLYAKNATEVTPGAFECNLDSSELSNVLAIAMKTAVFRNNVYNVYAEGDQQNNNFTYEIDGAVPVNREVVVPTTGFYTAQELLDILNPLILADIQSVNPGDTFAMTIEPYSKKITVAFTGVSQLTFDAVGGVNQLLGNTITSGLLPVGPYDYVFNTLANLGGLESVTVNIQSKSPKTILNVSPFKQRTTNSLGVIPVTVPFGGLQTFTQPDLDDAMLVYSYPEDLTTVHFTIRDVNGLKLVDQAQHLVIEVMVWFML
jgi:hypothetical protein